MKSIKCKVVENEGYGGAGIIPNHLYQWFRSSDAYIPTTAIGHDVIDHFMPDQIGSMPNELCAYGSIVHNTQNLKFRFTNYGRYEPYNGYSNVVADFTSFFQDAFKHFEDIKIDSCPHKVSNKVYNGIDSLFKKALFDNEEFFEYLSSVYEDYPEFTESKLKDILSDNWNNLISWITYGFVMAKKRYKAHDPYELALIKHKINKAGEKITIELAGCEVSLRYDIQAGTADYYCMGERV